MRLSRSGTSQYSFIHLSRFISDESAFDSLFAAAAKSIKIKVAGDEDKAADDDRVRYHPHDLACSIMLIDVTP